jgi:hypothetical protein
VSQEIRKVQTGDSRTLISMYLKQANSAGVLTAVDLTGLSAGAVQFEMFSAVDGSEAIALTSTGVTFTADATGLVNYQFATPMTITAGYYNAFFVLTQGGKTDHFPVVPGQLRIEVSSHTETAEAAYRAAVEAG